ncbi:MAG: phosphotransferase [Pseudomonadota bacterium]
MTIQHEMRQVLGHYDLGKLRCAQSVERGYVNQNWIIDTSQGRYFLKRRHPELRNPEVIRAQHALSHHLRQSGFPAPAILPNLRGETLLVLDGEYYEIQAYIDGVPYEHAKPAHFQAAVETLRRYHDWVQGFEPLPALCPPGGLYDPAILTARLTGLTEAWALSRDPTMSNIVRRLESQTADLKASFARHAQLPHLVIHGDYHADNLLLEEDRIVGVVDYDKARWQPRVVELAEVIIYFASPRPGHLKHLVYPGFLEWDKVTNFMHNYACALGLDDKKEDVFLKDQEISALPDYIRCIWLSVSLQRLLEKGPHPTDALEALREVLSLGEWSGANRERMIETSYNAAQRSENHFKDRSI